MNCIDHARRKFFDLESQYPEESKYAVGQLAKIYKFDSDTKQQSLSATERRDYHRCNSLPVMENLGKWMQESLSSGKTEENSPLGLAMNYCLKRWSEMTEFCHTPGVPLSNAECERAIKRIIPHRKASLFYKTAKGAHVGDVMQSLMITCEEADVSSFDYLAWLQENKSKVASSPSDFLPWMMPKLS